LKGKDNKKEVNPGSGQCTIEVACRSSRDWQQARKVWGETPS